MTTEFPVHAVPRGNDKIWAILSHLSTFLDRKSTRLNSSHT